MFKKKSKLDFLLENNEKAVDIYGHAKITYEQALDAGIKFYWTGEQCDNGHLTWNYTSTKSCRTCSLQDATERDGYIKDYDKDYQKKKDISFDLELYKIDKDIYDFED